MPAGKHVAFKYGTHLSFIKKTKIKFDLVYFI